MSIEWMDLGTLIWHPPQILQGRVTSSPTWQRRESLGSSSNTPPYLWLSLVIKIIFNQVNPCLCPIQRWIALHIKLPVVINERVSFFTIGNCFGEDQLPHKWFIYFHTLWNKFTDNAKVDEVARKRERNHEACEKLDFLSRFKIECPKKWLNVLNVG